MSFGILILLAIIQGLTEFLPVSSSGHLVLLYDWFGVENNTIMLSIILHVATLLSVLVYYRKELLILLKHPLCPTNRKIVVTTIFTCAVVLFIKPFIDRAFDGEFLFVFFIITAILLFISDYLAEKRGLVARTSEIQQPNKTINSMREITNIGINYKQAIVIGITQGVACIPGISRSGSTIAMGRIVGGEDITRYSFLISIPIIIASLLMEIMSGEGVLGGVNVGALIVSFVICFVVGLLCIKFMTKMVAKSRLTVFAYYLIVLSVILVALTFIK